ncbi:MAG: GYD domain-containing protein [Nitrospinae bacterium]|nr:GYD domain-containing protein [Nitrospinota bacterium]
MVEAPDDETITALALALGRLGNVTTQTMRAFPTEAMENIIGKLS